MKALSLIPRSFFIFSSASCRWWSFFYARRKPCQEDRNDHAPSRDARDSLTEGSARSMQRKRRDATRSISVIRRQENATARHGQLSESPTLPSILSARSAFLREDIHQPRQFTTLNRSPRAELTTSATLKLYVKPVMPEFMAKWATDGAEK